MRTRKKTGITGKARATFARILDHVLRDEYQLSATMRDYRWHLTGPNLYSLNRLFDEQRRQLDAWLDRIVSSADAAGFPGAARLRRLPKESGAPGGRPSLATPAMVRDLRARHEEMARRLREDIAGLADPATAALLTGLLEFHETTAWMLRMVQAVPDAEPAV